MDNEVQKMEKRDEFLNKARDLGIIDGAFEIVRYNKYYRSINGHPIPEEISMNEAFPDSVGLVEALKRAESLYNSSSSMVRYYNGNSGTADMLKVLRAKYPGFRDESYKKVLMRSNYMAAK